MFSLHGDKLTWFQKLTTRWRSGALAALVALVALATPTVARAQQACTPQTQAQLLAAFSDSAPPGSITPQVMRNFVCSTVTPALEAWTTPGVFTNTQMNQPFTFIMNNLDLASEFAATQGTVNHATQVLSIGVQIPSGATASQAGPIGAYVNDLSPASNAVGVFINCRGLAAQVQCFGINESVTDTDVPAAEGGTGNSYPLNALIANESDIECANLMTACVGYNMIGIFPNGSPGRFGYAYQASAFGSFYPWQVGFNCATGATVLCMDISPVNSNTPSNSQPIQFVVTAGDNSTPVCSMSALAGASTGSLNLVCQDGGIQFGSPVTTFANFTIGSPLFVVYEQVSANPVTSGTQAMGATTLLVGSTAGVANGNSIAGSPSIAPSTNVTVIDGTHLGLSSPLLASIANGVSLTTFSIITTGSISQTGDSFTFQSQGGKPIVFASTIQLLGLPIASLLSCNSGLTGAEAYVTNGVASPTYGATVSATGTTSSPVFCNGTNWTYQ